MQRRKARSRLPSQRLPWLFERDMKSASACRIDRPETRLRSAQRIGLDRLCACGGFSFHHAQPVTLLKSFKGEALIIIEPQYCPIAPIKFSHALDTEFAGGVKFMPLYFFDFTDGEFSG